MCVVEIHGNARFSYRMSWISSNLKFEIWVKELKEKLDKVGLLYRIFGKVKRRITHVGQVKPLKEDAVIQRIFQEEIYFICIYQEVGWKWYIGTVCCTKIRPAV